jgi:hypothetical protein
MASGFPPFPPPYPQADPPESTRELLKKILQTIQGIEEIREKKLDSIFQIICEGVSQIENRLVLIDQRMSRCEDRLAAIEEGIKGTTPPNPSTLTDS